MVEGLPERTNSGLPVWEVRCSTLGCASSALVCECRFFNPGVVDQLYRIVSVAGVLLHHAIGVEVGAVERQSSAHQVTPLLGSLQVQRSDGFLQLLVERCGLFCIASTVFNGPSGDSFNATFYPETPLLGSLQVQRSDGFLQLLVERCGLFCIASTVFNGPSGDSFNATFY